MQFKIVGVCVIILSSCAAAYLNTKRYKEKLAVNKAFLDFIEFIDARITFFKQPLPEIYSEYENETLLKSGFLSELIEHDILCSAEKSGLIGYLSESSSSALRAFSKRLGKSGAQEQHANCEMMIRTLIKDADELEKSLPDKTRVYSSLCVISGLAAALLIIV